MDQNTLSQLLGSEIEDADEETFHIFCQALTTLDLGFIDSKTETLELTIGDRDLSITQSPGLLTANRQGGTTGSVVWKVAVSLAEWLSKDENVLFEHGVLCKDSTILELGCGISGILPLTLAPKIRRFVATDQEYVFKLLNHNLASNSQSNGKSSHKKVGKKSTKIEPRSTIDNISVLALDWERDLAGSLSLYLPCRESVDLVIACDCIYNEALVQPFVNTCTEICQLRHQDASDHPTVCLVAQQLRSDGVFSAWLTAFMEAFQVWRMPDDICGNSLSPVQGFVVHLGILK